MHMPILVALGVRRVGSFRPAARLRQFLALVFAACGSLGVGMTDDASGQGFEDGVHGALGAQYRENPHVQRGGRKP